MSTYTDLHNRIKENLTILRKPGSKDDGMSPQKVILVNPENQFYGTFNGKMNVTSGILSGLKIIDSELEGVKLDDASVDGVSLGELKATVDVNTQDIEQLQKDAKSISAAHNSLSAGLSSAVDNLSIELNETLKNTVDEVKTNIGGVVGDVETLSIGLRVLNRKVENLSSGTLNGVVYKGQLVLHRDYYTLPRQLFNDDPACCLLEGTQAPLKNGWMWQVSIDHKNVGGDYVRVSDPNTGREIDLGNGDYIIIKNHLTSLYEVVPNDQMRIDDFDVINAQDEDDTKIQVLKQISAFLNSKIETLSSDLSGDIDELSTALSGEIDSLSTGLSNLISSLSGDLCAEIELDRKTIKEISAETLISANAYTDENIAELSDTTSSLVIATSADVLAQAKAYAEGYVDGRIEELSTTTDSRLSSLSNDLSSYSNKLCADLSTQVDAEFVHKSGDMIAELSVTGQLSVAGKTTLENEVAINARNHSTLEVLERGISAKTDGSVEISANEKIELKSKAPIDAAGSKFIGLFTHGVQISSTRGLDDFEVNGKTIQSSLVELSAELTGWTHTQDLELSGKVLTQVNNEFVHLTGDEISWIDVEKLSAADAKIKQLDALNIASQRLSVDSTNDIKLKTGSSIILSTASGIHTNVGLDKVVLAGTSLQKTIEDVSSYLNTEKLDVELANQLSAKICSDVVGSGYLKAISVDFKYDAHDKLIKLSAGNSVYPISVDDFIKDGILQDVKYDAVGDDTHPNPPYIVLSFNTDAGKDDIWLGVKELVDVYEASEDGITLNANTFSLKYDDIKEKTGLNDLSDDLYGVPGDPGTVGRLEDLQNQIDAISDDNFGAVSFTGHLVPDLNATTSYSSIGAFLQSTRGEDQHQDTLKVKNGASFNIYFKEKDLNNSKMISVDNAGSTLLLGNGDVLVVHDHSNSEYVALSDLLVATDENPISGGNVYILKAGVSRYEFEAEAKNRGNDDAFISAWIKQNFANTSADSYALTTTLRQDVSASNNLSVANDAFVLNDLGVGKDVEVAKNLSVGKRITSFDIDANWISSNYLSSNEISASKLIVPFNRIYDSSSSSETLKSVHSYLSSAIDKKIFAGDYNEKHISNLTADSLSVLRIGHDEFAAKVFNGNTSLSDKILYVVSSDNLDFYGERGVNLADPHDLSDATNKKYVDSGIGGVSSNLLEKMSKISGDLGEAISSKIYIEDRIGEDGELVSSYSDLSVIKLSSNEYQDLVDSDATLSNALYIVESDFVNAYGQQIKNLANPTDLSDAATKGYVDKRFNLISSNSILSSVFNSINAGGVGVITLEQSICAIYELVKILGYK